MVPDMLIVRLLLDELPHYRVGFLVAVDGVLRQLLQHLDGPPINMPIVVHGLHPVAQRWTIVLPAPATGIDRDHMWHQHRSEFRRALRYGLRRTPMQADLRRWVIRPLILSGRWRCLVRRCSRRWRCLEGKGGGIIIRDRQGWVEE